MNNISQSSVGLSEHEFDQVALIRAKQLHKSNNPLERFESSSNLSSSQYRGAEVREPPLAGLPPLGDDMINYNQQDTSWRERNLSLWAQSGLRQRLFCILEPGSFLSDVPLSYERLSFGICLLLIAAIVLSTISVLGLSYPEYVIPGPPAYWIVLEICCVSVFTVELAFRFMVCPDRLWNFALDWLVWIDIISILPFFLTVGGESGESVAFLRVLRTLRLLRLIRVVKSRQILGLKSILCALRDSHSGMFLFFGICGVGLLIFSTCLYYAERGEFDAGVWYRRCLRYEACARSNNTEPSPFQSIPGAFWFTVVNMVTVGFGDQIPKSALGQLTASCIMLSGVFVLAFPTMILSGHYEIDTEGGQREEKVGAFALLHARYIKKLPRPPIEARGRLMRRMRWNNNLTQPSAQPPGGHHPNATIMGDTVALFSYQNIVRELKRVQHLDAATFVYDPLLFLERASDGRPRARVIMGSNGMPIVVRFDLVMDDDMARHAAQQIALQVDPNATAHCDLIGGFRVVHHSPLQSLKDDRTSGVDMRYVMLPTREHYCHGNSNQGPRTTLPVYFRRLPPHSSNDIYLAQQGREEEKNLTEDMVVEEALAFLMGSSLSIHVLLPSTSIRKRVTILAQFFKHSRLHRELELYSGMVTQDVEDRIAFVSASDFLRLLEGVHRMIDLGDESLCLENPSVVDRDVGTVLLSRLRVVAVGQVPRRLKECIYNGEVLTEGDVAVEVPMSMFQVEEEDTDEVPFGYVEVSARMYSGRCVRLDFQVNISD